MMHDETKAYGVIVEWKDEAPIIMECNPMNWRQAHDRVQKHLTDPRVIRVAIFKAVYEYGNRSLLPDERAP